MNEDATALWANMRNIEANIQAMRSLVERVQEEVFFSRRALEADVESVMEDMTEAHTAEDVASLARRVEVIRGRIDPDFRAALRERDGVDSIAGYGERPPTRANPAAAQTPQVYLDRLISAMGGVEVPPNQQRNPDAFYSHLSTTYQALRPTLDSLNTTEAASQTNDLPLLNEHTDTEYRDSSTGGTRRPTARTDPDHAPRSRETSGARASEEANTIPSTPEPQPSGSNHHRQNLISVRRALIGPYNSQTLQAIEARNARAERRDILRAVRAEVEQSTSPEPHAPDDSRAITARGADYAPGGVEARVSTMSAVHDGGASRAE